jgi:hypothetical protein
MKRTEDNSLPTQQLPRKLSKFLQRKLILQEVTTVQLQLKDTVSRYKRRELKEDLRLLRLDLRLVR